MRCSWIVVLPGSMSVLSRMLMCRRFGVSYPCWAAHDAVRA
jgi:hypothetical protein